MYLSMQSAIHFWGKDVHIKLITGKSKIHCSGHCVRYWLYAFSLHYYIIFVYVIGQHAVQFWNNWMKKIRRTTKLDKAIGQVQFGSQRNFLNSIISKLDSMLSFYVLILLYIIIIIITVLNTNFDKPQCVYSKFKTTISITTITIIIRLQELNLTN